MNVGVVGLGAIGHAVAANLVAAGVRTMVWNRSPGPADALVERGAHRAADIGEVFRCDVVLSVLFDDAAVREMVLDSGLLASVPVGTIHVCMSTISTALVKDLVQAHQAHGLHYVAAPVFGRPEAAAAAQLVIATAGPSDVLDRIEPVLRVLGTTWRMGDDPRFGHLAKITGNFMIFSAVETMRQSAALIASHGGDPAPFLTMMSETLFAAPIYRSYGAAITGKGAPMRTPAALKIALKDVGLAVEEGRATATLMPLADLLQGVLRAASGRERAS